MTIACSSLRPRVAAPLLAALLGLSLSIGCGRDSGGSEAPAAAPSPPPAAASPKPAGPQAPPPIARVSSVSGDVKLAGDSAPLAAGAAISAGSTLSLAEGASAALDFPDGARATIEGPARVRTGDDRSRQLIVAEGSLRVQIMPEGETRRLSLRVATPRASLEFAGRSAAWVAVAGLRGTYVGLASGSALVATGGLAADDGVRDGIDLRPGQAVLVTQEAGAPLEVERQLDAIAAAGKATLTKLVEGADPAAERSALEQALDRELAGLDTLEAEGASLGIRQRKANAQGKRADVQRLQRALADYAQRLYRMRRSTLVRWERLQAVALAQGKTSELADRYLARVRPLIGAANTPGLQ